MVLIKSVNEYNNKLYTLMYISFFLILLGYINGVFKYSAYFLLLYNWKYLFPYISKKSKQGKIFLLLFGYFLFLIIRGVFLQNFDRYLYFDILIFSSVIFINFFNNKVPVHLLYTQIPELFANILIFSIPFAFISMYFFGSAEILSTMARSIINEDSAINEKAIINSIIIAPLLMPFIIGMKPLSKFAVLLGNFLVLTYGVFAATRVLIVIPILAFLTLFFQLKSIISRIKAVIMFLSFCSIFIFLLYNPLKGIIDSKIEYSLSRFNNTDNLTSFRDTEVKGLFAHFTITEFIFGRGAGAEQKFGFWEGQSSSTDHGAQLCHFGFLHLILKGGFILLFLIYGLSIYSIITLYRHGERKYFFVIILYLVYEISFTKFLDYFYVLFLWISISYALQISNTKNNNLQLE